MVVTLATGWALARGTLRVDLLLAQAPTRLGVGAMRICMSDVDRAPTTDGDDFSLVLGTTLQHNKSHPLNNTLLNSTQQYQASISN